MGSLTVDIRPRRILGGKGRLWARNHAARHFGRHSSAEDVRHGVTLGAMFVILVTPLPLFSSTYGWQGGSSSSSTLAIAPDCISTGLTISIYNVVAHDNSTNATVSWYESQAGYPTTFYWGNTTSYGYPSLNITVLKTYSNGSGSYVTPFLDYLDPNATTYFDIYISVSVPAHDCPVGPFQRAGSWSSPGDTYNRISGKVFDDAVPAKQSGAGIAVRSTCASTPSGWSTFPRLWITNASSAYNMPVPYAENSKGQVEPCQGGIAVSVLNLPVEYNCGPGACWSCFDYYCGSSYNTSSVWLGHWNETIVSWAPQVVNFYLPVSPLASQPIATAMEFTHTARATISFCKYTSSSWEEQSQYSVSGSLFGMSYQITSTVSKTVSIGSSSCTTGQEEPGFEAWGTPYVSGMLVFDSPLSRSVSVPWKQFYAPLQNPGSGNATGGPVTDNVTEPTQEDQACWDPQASAYFWHYEISAGSEPQTFNMYASGTVTGESGMQFSATVPLELDGVSIGSVGLGVSYSLTTTESNGFNVTANFPGPFPTNEWFTILCSGSTSSDTGIVMHVWEDSGPG